MKYFRIIWAADGKKVFLNRSVFNHHTVDIHYEGTNRVVQIRAHAFVDKGTHYIIELYKTTTIQ